MTWTCFRARRAAALGAAAMLVAACGPSSSPGPAATSKPAGAPTPNPTAAAEGVALIQQKGCGGCHTIPGVPGANGAVGPNLGGVASRPVIAGGAVQNNGPDDIKRWILDPPAAKPG